MSLQKLKKTDVNHRSEKIGAAQNATDSQKTWMKNYVSTFYKTKSWSETVYCGTWTPGNVYASIYRDVTTLNRRKGLTHMLLSCLVSNSIGFMQKSSLCHIAQSCKAPLKNQSS